MGRPDSSFIREGFAEFTEDYWVNIIDGERLKKSHYNWAKLYFSSNRAFDIKDILFDSERFYQEVAKDGCFYTYPLAGAFTRFLIEKYGKATYLDFYKDATKENLVTLYDDYDSLLIQFKNYVITL